MDDKDARKIPRPRQLDPYVQSFGSVKEPIAFGEVKHIIRLELLRVLTGVDTGRSNKLGHERM